MELFDVYSLYPVEPVRGSGSYVYDAAGTEYLDLYGGHASFRSAMRIRITCG